MPQAKKPRANASELETRIHSRVPNELRAERSTAEITAAAARRAGYPVIDLPVTKADPSAFIGEIKLQTLRFV